MQGLIGAASVFTHGAAKYGIAEAAYANNWLQGMRWGRLVAALQRHLLAHAAGDTIDDPEAGGSGLPHIWHALCCALMLLEYASNPIYAEYDDRPTKERILAYRPLHMARLREREEQQKAPG